MTGFIVSSSTAALPVDVVARVERHAASAEREDLEIEIARLRGLDLGDLRAR